MEYDLIKKDASNTLTADQINFATRETVQIVTNAISTMMLLTTCVQRNVLHYVKINHFQSKESVHYVMRDFSVLKDASNTLTADQINFATRETIVQIVTNAISTMMLLTACVQRNVPHYVKINHFQSEESVHYVMMDFSVVKDQSRIPKFSFIQFQKFDKVVAKNKRYQHCKEQKILALQ